MAKQRIDSLYADLDSVMDEQAFNRLDRTAPVLVGVLWSLVGRGEPPEVIATHVLRHNPAAWVITLTSAPPKKPIVTGGKLCYAGHILRPTYFSSCYDDEETPCH